MTKFQSTECEDQLLKGIVKLETIITLLGANDKSIELDPHGLSLLLDDILEDLKGININK